MTTINDKLYYTIADIAKMLEISEFSTREMIRSANLKDVIKVGRRKFIPAKELEAFLIEQSKHIR